MAINVKAAHANIKGLVHCTPLVTCKFLDQSCGMNVFMKAENFQKTGSFKIRGALNAATNLKRNGAQSLVTHSSGNFGQAIARAGQLLDIPAVVVMPRTAPQCKKDAVAFYGGKVVECEPTHHDRAAQSKKICESTGGAFISSSQNHDVIAGQGTMAIEILKQQPDVEAIVVPVAGGGMLSGVAVAAKSMKPSVRIYGAEPEIANSCYRSLEHDELTSLTEYPDTIADGLRTNIGPVTWPIIRKLVDDVVLVSEDEIKKAIRLIFERAKLVVEPSAAVAVAAVLSNNFRFANKMPDSIRNVAVVLSGGNTDIQTLSKCISF